MKSLSKNSVLPQPRLNAFEERLSKYTDRITALYGREDRYAVPESSLCISGDAVYQVNIQKELKRFKGIRHVILIGIGGSSLGTEAVYGALKTEKSPALTVIDEIDRESLERVASLMKGVVNPKDIAIVVVSKSGATTETMLSAVKILEIGERRYGEKIQKQIIFIGDKDTAFFELGRKRGALCLSMPKAIGGRYSVFTAVGIAPLTLLGIDTAAFRKGSQDAMKQVSLRAIREHAALLALHALQGVHTVNFFTFNKRLELCGYWYRQLLAESIGKNMTIKKASFSHQLLPIVSTSVDLHSMGQLFLAGYENIYTHFVYFKDTSAYRLLSSHWLLSHVPFLKGKRVGEVSDALRKGVLKAYDDEKLPYRVTELAECSAYEVGFLLNSLMCEVMCVAHALNVDAFDQPNVESYKKHTRAVLG
jgi:glucose-6-phosphate isomerase